MNDSVFDASVAAAILNNEPYDRAVLGRLDGAYISTVNYSEVWVRLRELGLLHSPSTAKFLSLMRIVPFTVAQARAAADLRPATKYAGIGLGDRACLALALELGADVYTTERIWAGLNVGCTVHLIR